MHSSPFEFVGSLRPVDAVTWLEAIVFCNKLSRLDGLDPCYRIKGSEVEWDGQKNGYRLPTELEWEYAASGGNRSKDYAYSGSNDIDAVGWMLDNSGSQTHNVGTKLGNELGIHDMSGNVWEWCWDWYNEKIESHTIRGGSWYSLPYSGDLNITGRYCFSFLKPGWRACPGDLGSADHYNRMIHGIFVNQGINT